MASSALFMLPDRLWLACCVASTLGLTALAQQPVASQPAPVRPAFAVASVKPSPADAETSLRALPDQFDARAVPLRTVILMAYELRPRLLVGAPGWVRTERFDIQAKTEGPVRPHELLPMLRSLLEERFGLRVKREVRELPVYSMVLARRDGALGPRIRRHTADCAALLGDRPATEGPAAPGAFVPCGTFTGSTFHARGDSTMGDLAFAMGQFVDRMVVDKTAVAGSFDLHLTFAATSGQDPTSPSPAIPTSSPPCRSNSG